MAFSTCAFLMTVLNTGSTHFTSTNATTPVAPYDRYSRKSCTLYVLMENACAHLIYAPLGSIRGLSIPQRLLHVLCGLLVIALADVAQSVMKTHKTTDAHLKRHIKQHGISHFVKSRSPWQVTIQLFHGVNYVVFQQPV